VRKLWKAPAGRNEKRSGAVQNLMATRAFCGPYSLNEVESVAGDFTEVLTKVISNSRIDLPPRDFQLTAIGCRWSCGCETRGMGTPDNMPACVWAACDEHDPRREERPKRLAATGFEDPSPIIVPREGAIVKPGEVLVLRDPS
jgi:hypothetical protein